MRSFVETPIGSYAAGPGYPAIRKVTRVLRSPRSPGKRHRPRQTDAGRFARVARRAGRADAAEWTDTAGRRYRVQSPLTALQSARQRGPTTVTETFGHWTILRRGPVRISSFERIDSAFASRSADPALAIGRSLPITSNRSSPRMPHRNVPPMRLGTPEFHELMTAIAGFPSVARRLGLIFELELSVAGLGLTDQGCRFRSFPGGPRALDGRVDFALDRARCPHRLAVRHRKRVRRSIGGSWCPAPRAMAGSRQCRSSRFRHPQVSQDVMSARGERRSSLAGSAVGWILDRSRRSGGYCR